MTTSAQSTASGDAAQAHGGEDPFRTIVSVNEGPRRRFPLGFYVVLVVAFFAVAAGLFWALGRAKPGQLMSSQSPAKAQGTPIDARPAFADKPLPQSDDGNPPSLSNASSACARKRAFSAGSARTGPCDMNSISAAATPTVSLSGAAVPGSKSSGPVPVPADRYGGDVFILAAAAASAPSAARLPAPPQEALDILRRAEAMRGGIGSSPMQREMAGPRTVMDPAALPLAPSSTQEATRSAELPRDTRRDKARALHDRRYLVLRGSHVDCFLTLAYVSEIAGEAHCVVARHVYGHDGTTLLVPRGSIANGIFRATSAEGERRAHVIWERLVTPAGASVSFTAKGTDALGGTGLPAEVDKRWADRLGVALAISAVKDASTAIASRRAASGAASEMVSSAQSFAGQVLQQTLTIRPSLYVRQGDAASIVLQSDLDFSEIYAHGR